MGGSQSQERVIGVEERLGDGEPQIIVTEEFMKHISDKQQGSTGSGSPQQSTLSQNKSGDNEVEENDDLQYIQSAQELLTGQQVNEDKYNDENYSYREQEDDKWKKKYELEKKKNEDLKNISTDAFEQAVKEVRNKFISDEVDDCYNRYPGKPLKCSSRVKEYMQCVEKHRKGLLQPDGV